jgi:hypothetical protein
MITLYGFGTIFPEGRGETKDLWAQWTLEETGLPYRVHALDHTAGELDSDAYRRISPFRQAPVIDDDGFVVAESAAIALWSRSRRSARTTSAVTLAQRGSAPSPSAPSGSAWVSTTFASATQGRSAC